jgi:hypothetical protein
LRNGQQTFIQGKEITRVFLCTRESTYNLFTGELFHKFSKQGQATSKFIECTYWKEYPMNGKGRG